MPTPIPTIFSNRLLQWFALNGRKDLPWQHNKTAYRVWVSEIMLQQTQVASVIGYYEKFMRHFPTLNALANADTDDVLKNWAGLGYYARARNLHKTAKIVQKDHDGVFPNSVDELCLLPGIGRSTAGAIVSIAMKQRAPILDGNVKRVLCRHQAIQTWSGERNTEKQLWAMADDLTPQQNVDAYTQAIMDLGATLCTRSKPKCDKCPVQKDCLAHEQGLQHELPVSKPKKAIPTKEIWLLYIQDATERILSEKRPEQGIWGGLYSLPEESFETPIDKLLDHAKARFNINSDHHERLPSFTHVFSHYKLNIHPVQINANAIDNQIAESSALNWRSKKQLFELGLPAPIKKFLAKDNLQQELTLE